MIRNTSANLGSTQAAKLVHQATSTRDAQAKLEALVESFASDLPTGFIKAEGKSLRATDVDAAFVSTATTQAKVTQRRLEQSIRSLRREASGRASETAMRVLANDAMRLVVEVVGWRRLGELAEAHGAPASGPAMFAVRQPSAGQFAKIQQLHRLLTNPDPTRHRALAALAFDKTESDAGANKGPAAKLTSHEAAALVDILESSDPQRSSLVRERIAGGDSLASVRHVLMERMIPISLVQPIKADDVDAKKDAGGLMFDLGTNTFVQRDRSWAYGVSVGQLFDYEVDGICDGPKELVARLVVSATDPTTGELVGATEADIQSFVDDLAAAASEGHPAVDALLGERFTMCFSTTDHGSKPVRADWELPRGATADIFHALTDGAFRSELADVAKAAREKKAQRETDVLAPLADLLAKYDGKPRRHKRAHAALINLGLAQQSIQQMGRDDGVLPKSKTLLDPATLADKYGDADHLKLRFLFTDEFELYVVSDQTFQEVVDKYHFPPNHELLSYNRPIAGSGYLTVHKGQIVGLEDDIEMLPGKLPDNLPPALLVLEARGFPLDREGIAASQRVLDWEAFADFATNAPLPEAPTGTPAEIREALLTCDHGDRPGLVFSAIVAELSKQRAGGDESVARQKTEDFAKVILEGFQIINVAAKHFREGDLPSNMSEFMEMKIDDVLAPFLVRKAASK